VLEQQLKVPPLTARRFSGSLLSTLDPTAVFVQTPPRRLKILVATTLDIALVDEERQTELVTIFRPRQMG